MSTTYYSNSSAGIMPRTKNLDRKKHLYTLLRWSFGELQDRVTTQSYREARMIWNQWDREFNTYDPAQVPLEGAVEFKIDGEHVPYPKAERLLRIPGYRFNPYLNRIDYPDLVEIEEEEEVEAEC